MKLDIERCAGDGSEEVEADAGHQPLMITLSDHKIGQAAYLEHIKELQATIERMTRAEKNDAIAYRASIEKQAELREELKFSRAAAATARNALADVIEKSKAVINGAEVIRAQRDEQDDIHTHEGWAMAELDAAVKAAGEAIA